MEGVGLIKSYPPVTYYITLRIILIMRLVNNWYYQVIEKYNDTEVLYVTIEKESHMNAPPEILEAPK